jgi:hypothetical protein
VGVLRDWPDVVDRRRALYRRADVERWLTDSLRTHIGQYRNRGTGAMTEPIYQRGAPLYIDAGWLGPLPFPPCRKVPPPTGFTGHDGAWPSEEQVNAWKEEKPPESNLGLRLQYGLVGIDVDAYDGKTGGRTLEEAESRWGPLPPTYCSSSRIPDRQSGIRLFRVPVGCSSGARLVFRSWESAMSRSSNLITGS